MKREERYEELHENYLAYLWMRRTATCLCHIPSLSVYLMHPTVSYHSLSVNLHLICKLSLGRGVFPVYFFFSRLFGGIHFHRIPSLLLILSTFSGSMAAIQLLGRHTGHRHIHCGHTSHTTQKDNLIPQNKAFILSTGTTLV